MSERKSLELSEVQTFEKEKELFLKIAPEIAKKIFDDRIPHIDNILFFICSCVEAMVTNDGKEGKEEKSKKKIDQKGFKRELVLLMIPTGLEFLTSMNIINEEGRKDLSTSLSQPLDVFLRIQNLVDVSNNPNLLNNKWIKENSIRDKNSWCFCI